MVKRYACLARSFSDPFVLSFFRAGEILAGANILHAHNAYSAAALSAALARRGSGIPTVLTHYGSICSGIRSET